MILSSFTREHIQEWLGHSDFSTTANIYAHLDYSSKLSNAEAMIAMDFTSSILSNST